MKPRPSGRGNSHSVIFPLGPYTECGYIISGAFTYVPHIIWCKENNIEFWSQPDGQTKSINLPALSKIFYFKTREDAIAFKLRWV